MYPQIKYIDSDGKTEKTDMSNKYFIMFQELDVQVNQLSIIKKPYCYYGFFYLKALIEKLIDILFAISRSRNLLL